jgi:biopolymer transport protein ExbD
MRLPRNLKMLRGPIDPSALAGTLLLLWTATLLHSSLVIPPGVRLRLPEANGIWGDVLPHLTVAVDSAGRVHYQHQVVSELELQKRLQEQTAARGTNLTLLLMVDRNVSIDVWSRLVTIARSAGVHEIISATSPRPGSRPLL